jgi:hypothetical protein
MTTTAEVLVLLFFLAMAGLGIASSPAQGDRTSANWIAGAGLLGAVGWVCWIFMRPGGDSFYLFWTSIRDFLRPN